MTLDYRELLDHKLAAAGISRSAARKEVYLTAAIASMCSSSVNVFGYMLLVPHSTYRGMHCCLAAKALFRTKFTNFTESNLCKNNYLDIDSK